ncbi:DgyrCDS7695 [Dimorphilus gyrociliatus]|uniref:DgyrCDS7695 n=1 Tax=Dimorphilus gyrociliatus TaxID=2664684 RepID=A0A7I8VSV3_9ANNE|nr:DgyrCDS7695 [Dimorphilus gyrociliatus]
MMIFLLKILYFSLILIQTVLCLNSNVFLHIFEDIMTDDYKSNGIAGYANIDMLKDIAQIRGPINPNLINSCELSYKNCTGRDYNRITFIQFEDTSYFDTICKSRIKKYVNESVLAIVIIAKNFDNSSLNSMVTNGIPWAYFEQPPNLNNINSLNESQMIISTNQMLRFKKNMQIDLTFALEEQQSLKSSTGTPLSIDVMQLNIDFFDVIFTPINEACEGIYVEKQYAYNKKTCQKECIALDDCICIKLAPTCYLVISSPGIYSLGEFRKTPKDPDIFCFSHYTNDLRKGIISSTSDKYIYSFVNFNLSKLTILNNLRRYLRVSTIRTYSINEFKNNNMRSNDRVVIIFNDLSAPYSLATTVQPPTTSELTTVAPILFTSFSRYTGQQKAFSEDLIFNIDLKQCINECQNKILCKYVCYNTSTRQCSVYSVSNQGIELLNVREVYELNICLVRGNTEFYNKC